MNSDICVKAEVEIVIDDENIDDIVATAFEGGINYWCDDAEVIGEYLGEYASEQISRSGSVKLHVIEPFEDDKYGKEVEYYVITKELLLDGIKRCIEFGITGFLERETDVIGRYTGKMQVDTCSVDAEVADAIIQLALFKDLIYG